jgi:biopolymer transport protein ExbB
MSIRLPILVASLLLTTVHAWAQPPTAPSPAGLPAAAASFRERLAQSVKELEELRARVAEERLPLARELTALESQVLETRREFQRRSREIDEGVLAVNNLGNEIRAGSEAIAYLANLFLEFLRGFEASLHVAELERQGPAIEAARLSAEVPDRDSAAAFAAELELVQRAIARLEEALGGSVFEGSAVTATGEVVAGTFAVLGPAAVFWSEDGAIAGTAEQRLGSLRPAVLPFPDASFAGLVRGIRAGSTVTLPLDPTLGDARKIEATKETLLEHVRKGGPVMIPIGILAGLALLVALAKWVALAAVRRPSRKAVGRVLEAIGNHDAEGALALARGLGGPTGRMLEQAVVHLREPREIIEETMYEVVLATRLRTQGMLPFIGITAASAPLLGLLGTVTGIMTTFKMITVFGTGDVKTLSGGISEALITTEFGLIVAIPSLLLHAFLSRTAKRVVDDLEKTALSFLNHPALLRETALARAAEPPEGEADRPAGAAAAPRARTERSEHAATLGASAFPAAGPERRPARVPVLALRKEHMDG